MRKQFATVLVTLGLALGVAGCSTAPAPDPEPTAKPTTTAAPTATPTPDPTPTVDAWDRFTDTRVPYSFDTPPGWSVTEHPSPNGDQGVYQFSVDDLTGTPRLYLSSQVVGLGGRCGDTPPLAIEQLAAESAAIPGYTPPTNSAAKLVSPQFVYRAMQTDRGVMTSLALSDEAPGETCFFYNLLHPAAGTMSFADAMQVSAEYPPRVFATMDEAKAYMQSDEYQTLKRILLSLQIAA